MFSDLLRVLRFPPNLWTLDPYDIMRRYHVYTEAANAIEKLQAESDAYKQELMNITNAKRNNKDHFFNDTEFAEWAISRCKHTLSKFEPGKTDE